MSAEYFLSWLPLDSKPWRIVSYHDGSFYKEQGKSLAFDDTKEAIAAAKKKRLKLYVPIER